MWIRYDTIFLKMFNSSFKGKTQKLEQLKEECVDKVSGFVCLDSVFKLKAR